MRQKHFPLIYERVYVCVFLPLLPSILSLRHGPMRPQTWSALGSPDWYHSVSCLSLPCVVPAQQVCVTVSGQVGWRVGHTARVKRGQTQTPPCGRTSSSVDKDSNWYFSIMLSWGLPSFVLIDEYFHLKFPAVSSFKLNETKINIKTRFSSPDLVLNCLVLGYFLFFFFCNRVSL